MPNIEESISEVKALTLEKITPQQTNDNTQEVIDDAKKAIDDAKGIRDELQSIHASMKQLEQHIYDQGVEISARGRLTDEVITKLYGSETKFSELEPYFKHLLLSI